MVIIAFHARHMYGEAMLDVPPKLMPETKHSRVPDMPKDPYYAFDESWTPPSSYFPSSDPEPQHSPDGIRLMRVKMRALPRLFATAILLLSDLLTRAPAWAYLLLILAIAVFVFWRFALR